MTINPCRKCGAEIKRVQDFGQGSVSVACKCGQRSGLWRTCDPAITATTLAIEDWNTNNPLDTEHPRRVECSGAELLKWSERAEAGECFIESAECDKGQWTLNIRWPEREA